MLFLGYVVISDLYLLQETVILKPCFKFSKELMLLLISKVTTETGLALFIWNNTLDIDVAALTGTCELPSLLDCISASCFRYYATFCPYQMKIYFVVNKR